MAFNVTMSADAQKKMREMGWADAVDGKNPRFSNSCYMEGHNQGKQDMGGIEEGIITGLNAGLSLEEQKLGYAV